MIIIIIIIITGSRYGRSSSGVRLGVCKVLNKFWRNTDFVCSLYGLSEIFFKLPKKVNKIR